MLNYNVIKRFLDDLRVNGFSIGVVEEQSVIQLLVFLQNARAVPDSARRLGNLLGPVLCCTAEQQSRFQIRFDAHFGSAIDSEPPRPPGPPPIPGPPAPNTHSRWLGVLEVWRNLPSRERREITIR